jgi:HK97 family phage portal protein
MGSAQIARERLIGALAGDRASFKNGVEFYDVPSSDAVRMGEIFGMTATDSGAVVNETTAMRVSAVYRCTALIAGAIAGTLFELYRYADGEREIVGRDHDLWWLLNEQMCGRFTAASGWEFLTAQMLLRGDGIAYIARKNRFSPEVAAIIPVPRGNVDMRRAGDGLRYTITDELDDGTVGSFTVDQGDIIHFPGFGFNGVCSMSVIQWAARQAIGIAIKADEHAAHTFASGASIQYAIKAPKTMTPTQQQDFRDAWQAKYGNTAGHSKIPLILTEGLDVTELSMTSEDAQLLESRKFQRTDIACGFGVPPHMVGESSASTAWGTGLEQIVKSFDKYTVGPHVKRLKDELNRKLFPRSGRYFIDPDMDAFLAWDSKAQAEYFSKALGGPSNQGWMLIDEVRRKMKLPPIAGGDKLIMAGSAPANVTQGTGNADQQPA